MIEIKNIFPNYLAISSIDLNKFKGAFDKATPSFESGVQTTIDQTNLFTKDEINYLNIKLTKIFTELLNLHNVKTFVFSVNGIWKNFYKKNDYQGTHVHPAHFSFIIYCSDGNTVFNSPSKSLIESFFGKRIFEVSYVPNCKKGNIIVFPSYLEHWVKPNSNNESIAGNIIFTDITYKPQMKELKNL